MSPIIKHRCISKNEKRFEIQQTSEKWLFQGDIFLFINCMTVVRDFAYKALCAYYHNKTGVEHVRIWFCISIFNNGRLEGTHLCFSYLWGSQP